jgi:hypothetical protein
MQTDYRKIIISLGYSFLLNKTSILAKKSKRLDKITRSRKRLKMQAFWDVSPCSLFELDRRFRGAYRLQYQSDNRGSRHLWIVGIILQRYYTALHPRKLSASYSPPWEPEISLNEIGSHSKRQLRGRVLTEEFAESNQNFTALFFSQ